MLSGRSEPWRFEAQTPRDTTGVSVKTSTRTKSRSLGGDWLTPHEVAERLEVRYGNVLAWIREGRLTAFKFGRGRNGRYRVRPQDLEAFMERARTAHIQTTNGGQP